MKTKVFQHEAIQARLELGPFQTILDDYVDELFQTGYPKSYLNNAFRIIIRFSDWSGLKHIPPGELNQERIDEFWLYHGSFRDHCDFKVLGTFIQFLRSRAFIPPAPQSPKSNCPIESMLDTFESYLREERGLSAFYIHNLVKAAKGFLDVTFDAITQEWTHYTAKIISDYITNLLKNKPASEVRDATRHLAQFFKFLFIKGKIEKDLSKCVPRPANWRHTRLPIYLGPEKVQCILESCDRKTQVGARDYAILQLLSRLGVRGCEIKNLNLEDLHWREGAITVRGKGKESRMPLPLDVGEAIATYIKDFRPKTFSRSLFVSIFPPYQGFKRTASVSGVVMFALKRANIESEYKGAHLLRHTVANECLKSGASLHEVAQLLRHDHLTSTTIYAKVDFARLSTVTQPWNGGGQ